MGIVAEASLQDYIRYILEVDKLYNYVFSSYNHFNISRRKFYPCKLSFYIKNQNSKSKWGVYFRYTTHHCNKGVAILLILVGHISGTFSTVIFTPLASAGVSLFLILSGYGLSESYKVNGLSKYWQKKITRVLLPYAIVITALTFAIDHFNLSKYLLEITGIKTSYWYIGYQMKWYLIFFLTMMLLPKHRLAVFMAVSFIMFFLLGSLEIEQSIAFTIGVLMSDYKERILTLSNKKILWIFFITFFIATLFLGLKQVPFVRAQIGSYYYSFIQMIQNVLYAGAIIVFMMLAPKLSRSPFLIFCGIISYEIYLLHFPFYAKVNGSLILAFTLIICSMLASSIFFVFNGRLSQLVSKTKLLQKTNEH